MIKNFIKSMLMATQGSISSKRVCGVLGWLVCLGICVYCTVGEIQAPILSDSILIGSAALMGVDSVTGIWKNKRDINIIKENETNVEQNNSLL
jgi:hypothetical protein